MDENLVLLESIKQYVGKKTLTAKDVRIYQETVKSIAEYSDLENTEKKIRERRAKDLSGRTPFPEAHARYETRETSSASSSEGSELQQVLPNFKRKSIH